MIEPLTALNLNIFHIGLYNLASLATLFVGLAFALLLVSAKRPGNAAKLFLSVALAVCVLKTSELAPFLLLALGPLLYFYIRQLTFPDQRFQWKDMLHFSMLLVGYWMPAWVVLVSVVIYLYLAHRLIEEFYRKLRPVLMDRPRFAFRRLERALLLLGLFCVASLFNDICYFAIALVLIHMAAEAILKPGNGVELAMPVADRSDAREKGRRLKEAVAANRLYEDAELTLTSLAVKLAIHPHDLSRIINVGLEKNFSDFINEFRVREVVRKMHDPAYDRLTLRGIAYESGFNSERTFHRVFKEMTGKTPLEYKNSLGKQLPIDKLAAPPRIRPVILRPESPPIWAAAKLKRNVMIKNYLKLAWRNTIGNKVYSALNITGLAAGIAVTLLIALWAWHEYSYDRFLPNYTQLYQVKLNFDQNGDIQTQNGGCLPIAGALRSNFPEVKYVSETGWTSRHSLIVGDKKLYQRGMIVGTDFLKMFQFHLLSGNVATVLNEPFSIVLTQSTAKALFGNDDPIGKMMRIDNTHDVKVAGLMDDLPDNSTLQFSFLLPFTYWEQTELWVKSARTDWTHYPFEQYVELQPGVTEEQFAPKIKNLLQGHDPIHKVEIALQPVKNWHLYSEFKNGKASGGFIVYVHMFCIIGALVLLIACINFVNLFTARSEKKAKEVGVRKAIGSSRASLIFQFLTESVLVTFIAALFAILIVQLSLPAFNSLTGNTLKIPYAAPLFWILLLGFILFTGVMAGSRPAFYLSSFNPVKVLRGTLQVGKAAALPRKILVVIQFTCSIALIVGTIIIYQQISHVKNRPTGYDADRLVMTTIPPDLNRNYTPLKNDLLQSGFVANVTRASSPIPVIDFQAGCNLLNWPGKNAGELLGISYAAVSEGFFETTGMKMAEGREFAGTPNDTLNVILNEAAVGQLRLKKPLGQMLTTELSKGPVRIIGVAKNSVIGSPFSAIQPALFVYNPDMSGTMMYRLKHSVNVHDAIDKLAPIFKKYNPAYPYDYQFADTAYDDKFKQAQLVGKLAAVFAGLTILISCLGLFGLAAYMAEQRTKEIGIRKVLGAPVSGIWLLLSKDFMVLVLIGCVIAAPLAFYFMTGWLQQYDYRISIGPGVFMSGIMALVITLFTISFQSVRAALADPVKSLRSE
ncbi:MAG: ABC transporter permease [Bacteroidota bacterium]